MASLAGYFWRETEFQRGLTALCGPNALAAAASRSLQRYVGTLTVFDTMRAHGYGQPSGASTISDLYHGAQLLKLPIAAYQPYTAGAWNWQAFIDKHVANGPVVIEVARGQALRDAITGKGENAVNLAYHFIAILGKDAQGRYLVADGDNYAVGNVLQTYTVATLQAAAPCAALAVGMVARIAPKPAPQAAWVAVRGPDGSEWWQQTATGKKVGGGLYQALTQKGWQNLPLRADERFYAGKTYSAVAVGAGLNAHVIVWDHSRSIPLLGYDAEVAADLLAA